MNKTCVLRIGDRCKWSPYRNGTVQWLTGVVKKIDDKYAYMTSEQFQGVTWRVRKEAVTIIKKGDRK